MNSRLAVYLLLAGGSVAAADTVKVGSKVFTESVILGEIITQLLNRSGVVAEHRRELGGTQILFQGLQKPGQLDVYVEYTGTLSHEILKGRGVRGDYSIGEELAPLGLVLGPRLGFVNNYALGIREERAEQLGIRTISDVKTHEAALRIAFSDEFKIRADGWPLVKHTYELSGEPTGMSHELALASIRNKGLDVTDLYTTDAEIKRYNLRTLVDDRKALSTYHAVLVWRADLEKRSPKAIEVLKRLENAIDNEAMVALNARVVVEGKSETAAAAEFIRDHLDEEHAVPPSDRTAQLARVVALGTLQHLMLVTVSLSFAILIAVPLGVLAYRVPRLGKYILGTVAMVQTVPSMALLVFLLALLPLGTWPALVALLLYSLLPIVRNTYQGLVEIPLALRESAEVIGLPERARLWRIELPLASRSILSGIKTAAVINVGTATIGAIVGAGGYGQAILAGIRLMDVPLILCGAIPAALMALLAEQLFAGLERFVVPRGLRVS